MKKMFLLIGCACLAGWFMWSEGLTHVSPVPEAPVVAEVEQPEYMVYITGAVRKPGLYSFPDVVTIGDAVHAAGDALPYAEASAVNYAARIEDGMQIHLPYNLDGVPAASESDGKININDAKLRNMKFTGTIQNNSLTNVLYVMSLSYPLTYTVTDSVITVSAQKNIIKKHR